MINFKFIKAQFKSVWIPLVIFTISVFLIQHLNLMVDKKFV